MSIPKPHKIIAVMEDGKQIPFPVLEEIYGAYICFLKRCEEYFLSSYSPPEEIHSVGDHISYEINLYLEGFSPDDRRIRELLFDCLLKRESCITGCDNMTEIDLIEMGSYIDLQGGNISLPRGYSSILEPINKNIPEEKIFTEHTVTKIKWQVDLTEEFSNKEKSGPVEVECKNGKKIRCDQVICTLPLGVLKEQASELFEPPLTVKKLKSIKNLMFGTVDKIILEYERPFLNPDISEVMLLWEKASENDESGNDVNMSWFRKIYSFTKLTDTLLLGWISGVAAEHMESLPEEEKAGVSKDRLTISSGTDDIRNLGNTIYFNGRSNRNIWHDKECDKVEGSDGSMFPPTLIRNHKYSLKIYTKEMCRSIPLQYYGKSYAKGIPSLRYKLSKDIFTFNSSHNSCYCQKKTDDSGKKALFCSPKGIFNTSACNFGAPMLSSLPHFYQADTSLLDYVDGLKPKKKLHETYVDIHPRLAVPIGGWSRVQINMEVRKADAVPFLGRLKDGTILPILWIEVGVDEIPDSVMNILYHAYYTANAIETCLQWGSLLSVFLSVFLFTYVLFKHRRTDQHSQLQRDYSGHNYLINPSV